MNTSSYTSCRSQKNHPRPSVGSCLRLQNLITHEPLEHQYLYQIFYSASLLIYILHLWNLNHRQHINLDSNNCLSESCFFQLPIESLSINDSIAHTTIDIFIRDTLFQCLKVRFSGPHVDRKLDRNGPKWTGLSVRVLVFENQGPIEKPVLMNKF